MARGLNHPAAGPGGMMQQIRRLRPELAVARAQPVDKSVTPSSRGGAATATMGGNQKWRAVQVSPGLLRQADAEMNQALILSALNLAPDQSPAVAAERLGRLTGGLPF